MCNLSYLAITCVVITYTQPASGCGIKPPARLTPAVPLLPLPSQSSPLLPIHRPGENRTHLPQADSDTASSVKAPPSLRLQPPLHPPYRLLFSPGQGLAAVVSTRDTPGEGEKTETVQCLQLAPNTLASFYLRTSFSVFLVSLIQSLKKPCVSPANTKTKIYQRCVFDSCTDKKKSSIFYLHFGYFYSPLKGCCLSSWGIREEWALMGGPGTKRVAVQAKGTAC